MPRLTGWRWYAGSTDSVEEDALYNLCDWATRDEAIAAGLRDTPAGGRFYIIEAVCSGEEPDDPDYGIPFVATQHKQEFAVSPDGATATPL